MNPKKERFLRISKAIICFAVILCYVIGIIFMFTDSFGQGVTLWVVSTLAGIAILFILRTEEKKAEDLKRQEEEERQYQAQKAQEK